MNKKILIGILTIAILLAGCVQEQPKEEEEIVIVGAILPLSGPVAIFGEWAKQGMDLALEDIGNGKITIIYEDSKLDAKEGISAFQKLVDVQDADIVISAMSSVSVPLIPLSEEKNVPLLLQDVTYPEITKGKPTVVRHFIQSDREASLLAEYALDNLGITSVGILYVNDEAGVGAKDSFKEIFEGKGGNVPVMESFGSRDSDMKTQIIKIKEANVEAIYLFGNGPSWAQALKEIKELGFEGKVLTNTAMFIPNFREIAGNSAEGVYFTYPYADVTSESAKKFAASYREKYGTEPAIEAYYGWDLIQVIAEVMERNDWTTENFKQAIINIEEFEGAFGKTRINKDGDFMTMVGIGVIEDEEIRKLGVRE